MPTPKEILALENDSFQLSLDGSLSPAKKAHPIKSAEPTIGKEGWLFREVEHELRDPTQIYVKVWVSVYNRRLLFSDPVSTNVGSSTFSLFEGRNRGLAGRGIESRGTCFGYLDLFSPNSEVKVSIADTSAFKSAGSASTNKHPRYYRFLVKDGPLLSVTFATEKESERDQWVELLRLAISGAVQLLSLPSLIIPNAADAAIPNNNPDSDESTNNSMVSPKHVVTLSDIDFPSKEGYLRKTSSGATKSMLRTVNSRWFQLRGGELRYYENEASAIPTKLKGSLNLCGAKLFPVEPRVSGASTNDTNVITLLLANGHKLKLEATTSRDASEWQHAFDETILLLNNSSSSRSRSSYTEQFNGLMGMQERPAVRRLNIHDRFDPFAASSVLNNSEGSKDNKLRSNSADTIKSSLTRSASMTVTEVNNQTKLGRGLSVGHLSRNHQEFVNKVNKSTTTMEMLRSAMSQNFLLKKLDDLTPLIDAMEERVVVPGEIVLWQGSSGDIFYVLENGSCEVIKSGKRVAVLPPGKAFGELALLNSATRQATIRASKVSSLWCLSRHQFRKVAAEQEAHNKNERLQFLQQIDMFSSLMPSSLDTLADVMTLQTFSEGERIIKQGESGDSLAFYMIISGRVAVTQSSLLKGSNVELVRLGPGKYFGELALIENSPRKASVTATTTVKCWTLDRQSFLSIFGSMDEVQNESAGLKMLQGVKLLEVLSSKQLALIARRLSSVGYVEGETIIKQGDTGDKFFMLSQGEVSVLVNHVQVATLQQGAFFGEMSLLSNERRSATVVALTDCTCLELSRPDFDELLGPLDSIMKAEAERRKEDQILRTSPSLKRSSQKRLSSSNSPLRETGSPDSNPNTSLMGGLRRMLSSSSSPVQRRNSAGWGNNSGRKQHASYLLPHITSLFESTNAMFEEKHLHRLKRLGVGTFGTVFLVQHILTDKYYALKMLHKQELLDKCQEHSIFSERDLLLLMSDSESGQHWVPALYATLQDEHSVFFVQQFLPGGDLWSILYDPLPTDVLMKKHQKGSNTKNLGRSKQGGLPIHYAQFYAANVVAAMFHLHDQEIIYRNLKPENLVVDAAGYLKLVDFGCAKRLPVDLTTNTLCGAPDYCAPEVILSRGHNRSVDFWGIGVLIFELLCRAAPFSHPSLSMTYQNIVESDEVLKFLFSNSMVSTIGVNSPNADFLAETESNAVSPIQKSKLQQQQYFSSLTAAPSLDGTSKNIITSMLSFNPHKRLGMLRNGYEDIWNHSFFKGISKDQIEKRQVTAPYIPSEGENSALNKADSIDDLNDIDTIEDVDDYPDYSGSFDYSYF